MFSGKSEELIRRLQRAQVADRELDAFKHALDDRYSPDHIVSHSQWRWASRKARTGGELLALVKAESAVVGIDEGHFFDATLPEAVETLARRGARVVVAGLDMDYLGRPFGPMPQLLAMADSVTKLQAVCKRCGDSACFTQRTVDSEERVLVGATEAYEPRCRACFVPGVDIRKISSVPHNL
jgi:thymidine kinase